MSGLFYGLEIARSSMYASQTALNIVNHNTANAETPGYTRQRVITQSIDPANLASRMAGPAGSAIGGGVKVQTIDQIRDKFLDRQFRQENSETGRWQTLTEQMSYIESVLNEIGDDGITGTLAGFFNSLSDLSADPTSIEMRTTVQQKAISLTESFNHYSRQFCELQRMQNDNIGTTVANINQILNNISAYNKHIFTQELSGEKANDLRDKRNLLLDDLAELVNIEYSENSEGMLQVTVDGQILVDHITANLLETRPELTGAVSGEPGFYEIYLAGSDAVFTFSSGSLMAYKQLRDDTGTDSLGLPRLLANLDQLAANLTEKFNEVHRQGFTLPYEGSPASTDGVNFFAVPDGSAPVTAANFKLSAEILANPHNIACSDQAIDLSALNNQSGNNEIILEMVRLSTSNDGAGGDSFTGLLKSLIVEVATKSSYSQTMYSGQFSVMENLEQRRMSVSGVSVDEEMINMVKLQHAYAAAARLISAIDQALEILISKTGIVGR